MVGRSKLAFALILFILGCSVNKQDPPCIQNACFANEYCTVETCINAIATIASSRPTSVEYAWLVNGHQVYDATTKKLSSVYFSKHDTIECVLSAVNNAGCKSSPDTVGPLIVKNSRPEIAWADFFPSDKIRKGTDISIVYATHDADDDRVMLSYSWYLDNELISTDSILKGCLLKAGKELSAEILPYDGEDYGDLYPVPRKLNIQNLPPRILGATNPVLSDSIITCKVDFVDPDGDEVFFYIKQGPKGMSIDDTGKVIWKRPSIDMDTVYTVVVQATDANGATSLGRFHIRFSVL